ncbi:major facilitator superfamily domain-containing protein [Xylogone sp. PMI_703]|nr:major facilitator superfamily domain-containing protein [Xylogone sp. PMI_703]
MALNSDKDVRRSLHVDEAEADPEVQKSAVHIDLKLDSNGLPLVPQPSDHKDDPLNWPLWYKYYVLFLICLLGFVVQFGAGFVPAAFGPIAKDLKVTHQQASYLTTTYTLLGGMTPLLITPFANVYGRRPVYIIFTLIAMASNIGSGYAKTYATEIVSRVFVGVGASAALAISGATICDMFFQGERGKFMGFYALAITNGPHFGPIAGGFVALNIGWRWIFFINAIMLGAVTLLLILTFPETLFSREDYSNLEKRSYWSRTMFHGKVLNRNVRLSDFGNNFKMMKYWAVIIPCVYYATANVYGSIIFVLTASSITEKLYDFDTAQNGLLLGIPLTLGCLIGESCTGWISDMLVNRYAARHDGYRKPEVRLHLAFLALFVPIGLIIHGVCVQNETPWIGLAVGMVVTSIGLQAGTTLTYAYCTDCYKPQAAEISTIINLARQMFAFTIGFYALPFGEGSGYGVAWGVLASIQFVTWLPLLILIWKGEEIRERQGEPNLHKDL